MSKRKFRTFNEVQIEHYRKHPAELKSYLKVALDEYQKDGNEKAFLSALSLAAKVRGFGKLAEDTGLNRENLYRVLSDNRDPRFSTVMQVLCSLGVRLKVA